MSHRTTHPIVQRILAALVRLVPVVGPGTAGLYAWRGVADQETLRGELGAALRGGGRVR